MLAKGSHAYLGVDDMDGAPAFACQLGIVKNGQRREPLESRLEVVLAGGEQGAAAGMVMEVLAVHRV